MAVFPLNDGHVLLLDDDDAHLGETGEWFAATHRNKTYVQSRRFGRQHTIHRVIVSPPDGMVVDHINGNPLDNRRKNLRVCTRKQNGRNKRPHAGRQFKGVFERKGRFRACIVVDGKQIPAGAFASPFEAAIAYDRAARIHHGEFARFNFDPARDWLFPYAIADKAGRIA